MLKNTSKQSTLPTRVTVSIKSKDNVQINANA